MKGSFKYLGAMIVGIFLISCERVERTQESPMAEEKRGNDLERFQSKIDSVLMVKTAWINHWSESLGKMNGADFELVLTDSIDPMEMPEANPVKESDPLFPYQFLHPKGKGEAQEILDQPFLNPDSEVIWYREDGMKERLLFMGPSGMFEDGFWLNEKEFLVLGYIQEEQGFRPMVWVIDVVNHRFSQLRLNKGTESYHPESYLDKKLKAVDLTSNGI